MDNNEFILAVSSILHDIGKIEQRFKLNKKHAELGYEFIRNNITKINKNDRERIEKLVRYHHTNVNNTDLSDDDKHLLNLLKIADWKSAAHDRNDKDPDSNMEIKLEKISDLIKINSKNENKDYYDLKTLDNLEEPSANFGYRPIFDTLKKDLESIDFSDNNKYKIMNKLNTILYKDTATVPSAFYYSEPNISLYHHLKLTAAIALALYRYEKYNKLYIKNENDEMESFILLMCNISGIQEYIFRYFKGEAADSKGTKRLKGRSFMIKLFTDSIESYIIYKLDLNRFNIVWEKSDGFLLMLEKTDDNINKLKSIRKDIDLGLMNKHRGITAVIDWVYASLKDLNTINNEDDLLDKSSSGDLFGMKMQELYNKIDLRKRKKLGEIFIDDQIPYNSKFGTSIKNMCESCGLDSVYKDDKCIGCLEEEYIGTNLYKDNYLIQKIDGDDIDRDKKILFNYNGTRIVYYFSNKKENEIILINEFCENYDNYRFIFQARYVPLNNNNIVSINEIFNDNMEHKMLGIFKADVDNMGAIIAAGFKNLTISRLASLSFEFEYFFSVKLDKIAEKSNVYIIYSGGDDVSAIGKIGNIILFIDNFHKCFEEYFKNGEITISAGITITDPKFPIRRGIINAEESLEMAKNNINGKKNSINFFDTMTWDKYKNLIELGNLISEEINNDKLSNGFPYFLYALGREYNRDITAGTVISSNASENAIIIPDPLVTYYINRNYKSANDIEKESLINKLLQNDDDNFKYMNFLSSYIVIKTRCKNGE